MIFLFFSAGRVNYTFLDIFVKISFGNKNGYHQSNLISLALLTHFVKNSEYVILVLIWSLVSLTHVVKNIEYMILGLIGPQYFWLTEE